MCLNVTDWEAASDTILTIHTNCEGPLDQSYLWTKCKERETQRHIIGVVVDRTWKPWAVDRPQGDRYRLTPSHYIHHRVTYTYVT